MSFGASNKNTSSASVTNPWAPAINYLTDFLSQGASASNPGATSDQLAAFDTLKANAAKGNPFASDINALAKDQFGAGSNSAMVMAGNDQLQKNLGDYASGKMLDFDNNPYVQKMLETTGNDVQNRINQMFAGSGRDITGNAAGQQAIARGVSASTMPILSQLYQQGQQNQITAAQALNAANTNAATTGQTMDQNALATRAGGLTTAAAGVQADNYAPQQILNLEQQLKQMPLQDLSLYANLLLPVAGLGGSSTGTSKTNGLSFGFSL